LQAGVRSAFGQLEHWRFRACPVTGHSNVNAVRARRFAAPAGDAAAWHEAWNGQGMAALIVPRGETDEFYEFLRITAKANGEQLIIDRRHNQRRRHSGHVIGTRQAREDRRGPIPEQWQRDEVILIE
jgi:hypothetical protein